MSQEFDKESENILYELLIYAEWAQDPETKCGTEKVEENLNSGLIQKYLGLLTPAPCPPLVIQQLIKLQMPWTFAIGGNGAVIAILQDTTIEIRTSRDEYGAVIGRTKVNKDLNPQWRKLLWSPDCTMLVLAHSDGKFDFFDLIGAHMFTIENADYVKSDSKNELRFAVAGMAFSDVRVKNTQWSYEFLVAHYSGTIKGYFVSPSDGFTASHVFSSLSNIYPLGISCFMYHPMHNILIISGNFSGAPTTNEASQMGMSAWRMISGPPYYKLALSLADQLNYSKSNWWKLSNAFNLKRNTKQDFVFKMSISPNGSIMAAIHVSGALSLWDMPSLRLKSYWPLHLQPNAEDIHPELAMRQKKEVIMLKDTFHSHITDINWWSDEAIIMVRRCGAVTVSSISSLRNLLGISPEWFEPSPAVTSYCDRGFFAMECEVHSKSKRRKVDDTDFDVESSEDDEPSVFAYSAGLAKRVLYFITDSDRFQPPRKKMKVISKTYRLLCLKSTTPDELYTRKINNEEYGEALALAKTYNLDCDLVYQRQWRKMPVTVDSINDYLSKITKRSWVLHECLERVPESFEAAKELLMYGLRGTDLKALIAIGKGEDHGRFILSNQYDDIIDEDDPYSFEACTDAYEERKQKQRSQMLAKINFKKLNLEQKQLCQNRLKFLIYLDRLMTYEIVLGGSVLADERYDHTFFKKFRSQCGLEAALHFANHSNWEAVAALFTYHGSDTLKHRLAILSHFPETTSPSEYHSLLPLYNEQENIFYSWDEHALRDPDWCEIKFKKITNVATSEDFVEEFYEKHKDLVKYRLDKLDSNLVTEWFLQRAKEIEGRSGLVDNALKLVELAIQRNIMGLEKLYDDLFTLDILIYDCLVKQNLCLKDYQALTEFDKVKLMMSTTSPEQFLKHLQMWLLPFLERCEKSDPGCGKMLLKNYILSKSKNDLLYCKKILEKSKVETNEPPIIPNVYDLVTLCLECVFYCESTEELKNAKTIYDLLCNIPEIQMRQTNKKILRLQNDVTKLIKYIKVAELLARSGLSVTLAMLQNISENGDEVKKILTKLTRSAGRKIPSLDEEGWLALLSDILEMHDWLFKCITQEDCYEVVLQSLLCSGKSEDIALAGKMLECNNKAKRRRENFGTNSFKLPYEKAVKLVLNASQEFFNSAVNSSDPCMTLARTCLNLIEDVPASIEEELDLISSVSLLQDFNVNVLPLQVRLCEDRISLIQEVLQKNEKSYKKCQKLMKLAYLLRAWSNDIKEREGKVLTLIGECAFQAKDYNECLNACQKLMDGPYKDGWLICYTLGSCDEFSNLHSRCDLLSFSISYCSEELIETILKRRSELQLEVLQARVKYLAGDHVPYSSSEDLSSHYEEDTSSVWNPSAQALQVTTQTTKAVLSSVKSVKLWKDAIKYLSQPSLLFSLLIYSVENVLTSNKNCWIQPLKLPWNEETLVVEDANKNLTKQGICAFYDGLIENRHNSVLEVNYERYARPDLNQSQEIAFCILRASLLEDSLKFESSKSCIENSVLLDMSKVYLPEDLVLSLCILLSLKGPEEAESLFQSLPSTPVVFQFASLYYACCLICCKGMSPFLSSSDADLDPSTIINKALDLKNENLSGEFEKLWQLVHKYNEMVFAFLHAELLHSIGGGVDAARFTNDDQYKKDTILGISMTVDDNAFHTAISLAHHYGISLWDLYMSHLEYLFSESSISAAVISEREEKLKLLEKLIEQKKPFAKKLKENVYSFIHGQDHEKLNLCFTYMEMCGDHEDEIGIRPSLHKKMLCKLKQVLKSIDYKLLMTPTTSRSYLSKILNESIVHVISKIASNIPKEGNSFYEPGNIFCIWIEKFFFEGNSSTSKTPQTKTEWIHRYESCTNLLQQLKPANMIEFIDAVIFSKKALEKMSIDCRADIVKRTVKFSRMKCSKSQSEMDLKEEWNQTVNILMGYLRHLVRMEDETLKQYLESYDPKIQSYCQDFDLSKSEIEKLQDLLSRIVLEGPDLQLLKDFLSCCPEEIAWEPSDAYIKAIHIILAQMRDSKEVHPSCVSRSPLYSLEVILEDISTQKDELMIEDLTVDILNEFCQDSTIPVTTRLGILQLLEKTNCLCPEYGDLLLLYRTQAIISSSWPDLEVSEAEVKDDFERQILFNNLMSLSHSIIHFDSLSKLLNYWPTFPIDSKRKDCKDKPWTKLICGLLGLGDQDALNVAVKTYEKALSSPHFCKECSHVVFAKAKETGSVLHILKFALLVSDKELQAGALEILKQKDQITREDYDDCLCDLLLKQNLIAEIISTSLYRPVIEFLLHREDDHLKDSYKCIDSVVKELYRAGYKAEAGSLLHFKNSTHAGLSTYSSATSVLHRWLSQHE